jgi:hypothetical protein
LLVGISLRCCRCYYFAEDVSYSRTGTGHEAAHESREDISVRGNARWTVRALYVTDRRKCANSLPKDFARPVRPLYVAGRRRRSPDSHCPAGLAVTPMIDVVGGEIKYVL